LKIWKTLGHKKTSGQELHAQLRKYLDQVEPYNSSYTPNQDTPYLWWNSIIDGRSSLSRLAKIIFSITPHSASCERMFSSLGWLFGKRRTNLSILTLESMAKIYRHNINYDKKLNYVAPNDNDIQQMLDLVYEEGDVLNENDDDEDDSFLNELVEEESSQINNAKLDIEDLISLEPWIYINNEVLPKITRNIYESDDDDEWDPEEIINN
jgi:hypothetical protein